MAHSFDTGIVKPQRTLIRDAIVERLSPLLRKNGRYAQAIKAHSGIVRSGSDEELDMIADTTHGAAPYILVAVGKKSYSPRGMDGRRARFEGELEVVVYVCSKNLRGDLARLAGDAASSQSDNVDPGIEVMLEHVEELLIGFAPTGFTGTDPSATIHRLDPVEEDELAVGEDLIIYRQVYSVAVARDLVRAKGITQPLTKITTDHKPDGVPVAAQPLIHSETDV